MYKVHVQIWLSWFTITNDKTESWCTYQPSTQTLTCRFFFSGELTLLADSSLFGILLDLSPGSHNPQMTADKQIRLCDSTHLQGLWSGDRVYNHRRHLVTKLFSGSKFATNEKLHQNTLYVSQETLNSH